MNEHEKALQNFIDANPKAKRTQFMIDKRLDLCKSNTERLVVIFKMMGKSFERMRLALNGELVDDGEVIEFKPTKEK